MFKFLKRINIFREIRMIRNELKQIVVEINRNTIKLEELRYDSNIIKSYIKTKEESHGDFRPNSTK